METIHKANPSVKSRYVRYLEVEEMEDVESPLCGPNTGLLWYTTKEEQRKINKERKQEQKEQQWKRNREIHAYLDEQVLANGELGKSSEEEVQMPKRDLRRKQDKWYSNCWNKQQLMIALVKAYREEAKDDPVAKAELHTRIVSKW